MATLLAVGVGLPLIGWSLIPGSARSSRGEDHVVHVVARADFAHEITERGEIESSSNDELRCQVRALNSTGTAIVRIVPEGTTVEPGDELVAFDSAALEAERQKQKIACNTSAAKVTKASNAHKAAIIAKREYEEGTFIQEDQTAQADVFLKEETLRQAQRRATYSARLVKKGYVSNAELEADLLAVKKAGTELDGARTKLKVLREFTREKKLLELEGAIDTTRSEWEAETSSHQLDLDKLKLIESEIEKCVIRAPVAGQVVYPEPFWNGDQQVRVGVGVVIREGQLVLRLPDLNKMQVNAKIHESKVHHVRVGMSASVRLEALPDAGELTGRVLKIKEYPEEVNFWNSAKQYSTVIELDGAPPGVRPGMTAEVKVHVESRADVLQIPVQAVVERAGKYFCALQGGSGWAIREVEVGPSNDKTIVILSGLEPGEAVMLDFRDRADQFDLPDDAAALNS